MWQQVARIPQALSKAYDNALATGNALRQNFWMGTRGGCRVGQEKLAEHRGGTV